MKIEILTLFPEMFAPLETSILKRAQDKNLFELSVINIRDFSENKHKKCDDYPFGGGAGMVMMAQPIASAVKFLDPNCEARRIYMSPKGERFTQEKAIQLSKDERILILCGHYEGVDQRVLDKYFHEEISIGDYVLTGGELGAMVVVDAFSRLIEGVIEKDSLVDESFTENLLEYPQYTRPSIFEDMEVPDVLLSGHHKNITEWRRNKQYEITTEKRPDLLKEKE